MAHFDGLHVEYVDHPRFGRVPRLTGVDPDPQNPEVQLHWNAATPEERIALLGNVAGAREWILKEVGTRIPGTAIQANVDRQCPATLHVTHYYDIDRVCRGCGKRFIFFAEEQKYWYETLRFPLEAEAVSCAGCRRADRRMDQARARYEALITSEPLSWQDGLEAAKASLVLVEGGVFHLRQLEHIRALLNRVPEQERSTEDYGEILSQVQKLEGKDAH